MGRAKRTCADDVAVATPAQVQKRARGSQEEKSDKTRGLELNLQRALKTHFPGVSVAVAREMLDADGKPLLATVEGLLVEAAARKGNVGAKTWLQSRLAHGYVKPEADAAPTPPAAAGLDVQPKLRAAMDVARHKELKQRDCTDLFMELKSVPGLNDREVRGLLLHVKGMSPVYGTPGHRQTLAVMSALDRLDKRVPEEPA